MSWWPAAGEGPWTWAWQGYAGVWLLLLAVAAAWAVPARAAMRATARPPLRAAALFAAGLLVLWAATDWPLGPLAARRLAFHAVQFLALSLAAAPLLLLGVTGALAPAFERRAAPRVVRALSQLLARPALPAAVFALVVLLTHVPAVLEARHSQAGSFALVLAWLGAALIFWWPLVGPAPERRRMPYLWGLAYLFLPFLLPKLPGAFFIFSSEPLYDVYATAQGPWALSPLTDQQLAGFLLWVVGSLMVVVALAVLFFRWQAEDQRITEASGLAVPADPRALDLLFAVPGAWPALERLVAIAEEALPASASGVELAFAYGPRGGGPDPRVVLELRCTLDGDGRRALAQRVERQFAVFLSTVERERRASVAGALGFRVVGYSGRVS